MTDDKTNESKYDIKFFDKIESDCKVDLDKPVEHPPVAISMGNYQLGRETYPIPIGTYGNFSFIQAPPKTKKTFFVSLLSSVYLNDTINFGGELRGHRNGKALVHFDTEQGHFHAHRVFKRPLEISKDCDRNNYHTFALRKYSYKERLAFIEHYLYNRVNNVGLVIIDGIADLCGDVNDIEQSNIVVQHLMRWTEELKCHIITVIHSNFGTDKPTGHLGSFLEKKTETQIQLEANTKNDGWVTVSCKRSRGYSYETFSFEVNKYGLPQVLDSPYNILDEGTYTKRSQH